MDQFSIDAFTPLVKKAILRNLKIEESELNDLGGFESFVFERPANSSIIRMTHVSHRDEEQIQAELEFVYHLADTGAAVCKPLHFDDGKLIRVIDEFLISQFERAPGKPTQHEDWNNDLYQRWGSCIGHFHTEANTMVNRQFLRMKWDEDENINFRARIPSDQESILHYADDNLQSLSLLPQTKDVYGLIHCDAHIGNFFEKDDKLTFFDFDDCCYQWFVFDVATILLGAVIRPSIGLSRHEQNTAAIEFLKPFFDGYNRTFEVNAFMLENMPLFLKTRELSLYAVILDHVGLENIKEEFPKRFMMGRQARLLGDEPFLDIDFVETFG
jgi:Ser/Thr protein kinase RdoA (MazF antagonist)